MNNDMFSFFSWANGIGRATPMDNLQPFGNLKPAHRRFTRLVRRSLDEGGNPPRQFHFRPIAFSPQLQILPLRTRFGQSLPHKFFSTTSFDTQSLHAILAAHRPADAITKGLAK
jgi:hypothetical protein